MAVLCANDVLVAVNTNPSILGNGKITLLFPFYLTKCCQNGRRSCLAKYRLKWLIPQDLIRRTIPTKD